MLSVLEGFPPDGLATAEVASVLRPSELVDADPGAAESELATLAAAGRVAREPLGQDAFWRLAAAGAAAA